MGEKMLNLNLDLKVFLEKRHSLLLASELCTVLGRLMTRWPALTPELDKEPRREEAIDGSTRETNGSGLSTDTPASNNKIKM